MVTAGIRAFSDDDIDQVTRLHRLVFPPDEGPAPDAAYRDYFRATFLSGPQPESGFDSLVYQEPDGAISGFLGVVPVRLAMGDRPLWATICTQFCVDPGRRGMAGLKLVRHHFAGRQDLSITDGANATTMRLWRWAGADPVVSCSLHFLRPLQPAQLALSLLARRPALARAEHLSATARLLDRALARFPQRFFRLAPPSSRGEPLDAGAMAAALPEVAAGRALAPLYEAGPLAWYLRRAEAMAGGGLRGALVRDAGDKLLGWYLYSGRRGATAEVLQIAAPPETAPQVIDHMLYDAWQAGMVALKGRLDPALAQPLSDRYCVFTRRGPWMVVHARDPALLLPFHRGDAMFTRLEGEWCARFTPTGRVA